MKDTVVATILFADLMNSTEIAKNLSLQEYDDMIVCFQSTMYEVVSHHMLHFGYQGNGADSEWSVVGDELRVFFYSDNMRFDVRNALILAAKVKLAWLAASFNQKILEEGRLVSKIGVGMNCGKVIRSIRKWRLKIGQWQPNIEGYAINLTKRIESMSRDGSIFQIMVGDGFYKKCLELRELNVTFSKPLTPLFKGISQKVPVYEVTSLINFEIFSTMPTAMQCGLQENLENAVMHDSPEPWSMLLLLRQYISMMLSGRSSPQLEAKALKVAEQAKDILEYKSQIFAILGWLYTYGLTIYNVNMAFHFFDQALGLDPKNQAALLHRARLLDKIGQIDLARHAYQEIVGYDREHPEARRKLAQFESFY